MANAYAYTTGGGTQTNHYEYVFTDGTLYVYNLDATGFPLVKSKSIPTSSGTRGAVACVGNSTLYVSFGGDGGPNGNGGLFAYDLLGNAVRWTQNYSHGIDSHAITSDCALIYMPAGELANTSTWHVVDAKTGNEIGTIAGSQASHPVTPATLVVPGSFPGAKYRHIPELRAGVGIEGVNRVVLCRDERNVVNAAGYG